MFLDDEFVYFVNKQKNCALKIKMKMKSKQWGACDRKFLENGYSRSYSVRHTGNKRKISTKKDHIVGES